LELNIKDVSVLLQMAEKEIHALIRKKEIPFQIVDDVHIFNKQKTIEWALIRSIPLNISDSAKLHDYHVNSISALLDKHSFYYNCDFSEETYIPEMVNLLTLEKHVDKSIIIQLLKSREELMSTAIGNGIALPHPRIPLALGKDKPVINFFFPQRQLVLNSPDEKPVHTIILLISQTIKQHLSLLAHLSFLLAHEKLQEALKYSIEFEQIIKLIKEIESTRSE